uniref:MFS domain-containing protein n=1 Tax=Heligmosomoides polygyrus TaxID=6339 RepID=A0A183GL62_HELPZ
LAAPLIGTWSDKKGRKNPLLYALFGLVMYTLCHLMATITYEHMSVYYWFFAGEISIGFTGSIGAIYGTSLAIVTDDCRNKLKPGSSTVPMRIGVASFVQSIGSILGTMGMSLLAVPALAPSLSHKLSFFKASLIQVSFALAAFIYAYFLVRETHFPLEDHFLYNRLEGSVDTHIEEPKSMPRKLRDNFVALLEVGLQFSNLAYCAVFVFIQFSFLKFQFSVCEMFLFAIISVRLLESASILSEHFKLFAGCYRVYKL